MDTVKCRDKKPHNVSEYSCTAYGLTINSFTVKKEGYITSWQLATASGIAYEGKDQESLIDTFAEIAIYNGLGQNYKNDGTQSLYSKKMIVIYTDEILKLKYFMKDYISNSFGSMCLEIMNVFDVRSIHTWAKKIKDIYKQIDNKDVPLSQAMAMLMQKYFDDCFIEDKKYYVTPVQIIKREIESITRGWKTKNKIKEWDIETFEKLDLHDTIKNLWPKSHLSYELHRKALFGGIIYDDSPEASSDVYPFLYEVDATSAYIYQMVCKKYPMREIKLEYIDYSTYKKYLDLDLDIYSFIGEFYIEWPNKIPSYVKYIRDKYGNEIKDSKENKYILTSVDVYILQTYVKNIKIINTGYLHVYENDYLPTKFRAIIVREFLEKATLKKMKASDFEYEFKKAIVNACYGLTIKDFLKYCKKEEDKKRLYKRMAFDPSICYQWGIFTSAYARKTLLDLAMTLEGWVKSDTDSIFCYALEENLLKILAYNDAIEKEVENFIATFDFNLLGNFYKYRFDLEDLKTLGQFKFEAFIDTYIAWGPKSYAYHDYIENKWVPKISGLQTDLLDKNINWSKLSKDDLKKLFIPVVVYRENKATTTWTAPCGKQFTSCGSAYSKEMSYDEYVIFSVAVNPF